MSYTFWILFIDLCCDRWGFITLRLSLCPKIKEIPLGTRWYRSPTESLIPTLSLSLFKFLIKLFISLIFTFLIHSMRLTLHYVVFSASILRKLSSSILCQILYHIPKLKSSHLSSDLQKTKRWWEIRSTFISLYTGFHNRDALISIGDGTSQVEKKIYYWFLFITFSCFFTPQPQFFDGPGTDSVEFSWYLVMLPLAD